MLEWLTKTMALIASNFWNPYSIAVLLGTGLILSIATRFVQIRRIYDGMKLVFQGAFRKDISEDALGDISPFQALTTALSATVGNGNIAGVATTVALGGPGGIFWMWMTALVGMATKYSEALLGVHFRRIAPDGTMSGGPMYYIRDGLRHHQHFAFLASPLATIFAICGAWTALFGTGNVIQANSIALAFRSQFNIPDWISASVIAILTALVIIGGIKRIGAVTERLVPVMIILYMLSGFIILILNINKLSEVFIWILKSAFTPQAALGGFIGHSVKEAMQLGVSRGLLSNEAGLGSAPIAYGAAKTRNPINQGLIGTMEVFIDTIIVCSMTAFVILVTEAYQQIDPATGKALTSTALTIAAFNTNLPVIGGIIVAFSSFLFGYSTLIGWYYYGEQCMRFLLGLKIVKPYQILFILLSFFSALLQGDYLTIVWDIGVVSNGLMALPNLVGLLALIGTIASMTKQAEQNKKIT